MIRRLSHSEIGTVLDCEYRWDYGYGGRRLGTTVKPKAVAPKLSAGRVWGAGVAAYCANVLRTDGLPLGHMAIDDSLEDDAQRQVEFGVHDPEEHQLLAERLHRMLDRYAAWTVPFPVDRLEYHIEVPIRARTSRRPSSIYRFEGYIDSVHVDDDGREWLVDYKFRGQLSRVDSLVRAPQFRRYAWAAREKLGIDPVGFIVDEWLDDEPKPPRILKSGRPSHDADQKCLAEDYLVLCAEHGVEPSPEAVENMRARRWFRRERILFRDDELDEVGDSLISAAQLIRDLDSGARTPIANPGWSRCPSCAYADICPEAEPDLVDMLYERTIPKRDRRDEVETEEVTDVREPVPSAG